MAKKQSFFSESIGHYLLMLCFAFPVLPFAVTNILFITFSLFVLYYWIFINPLVIWKTLGVSFLLALPFIPYLFEMCSNLNSMTMQFEFQKKLLFFIAPISIPVYVQVFKPFSVRPFFRIFTYAVSLLSIYALIRLMAGDILFSAASYENEAYILRSSFEQFSNLHPTYFGLFAAISFIWILYDHKEQRSPIAGILYVIMAIFLLIMLFLVAAKMPLLILITGTFWVLFKTMKDRKKLIRTYLVLSGLLICISIFIPSVRNRLPELRSFIFANADNRYTLDQRELIFDCSKQTFMDHFWTGVGARNSQMELDKQYKNLGAEMEMYTYNSHNQFLTLGINYGIAAVLLLGFSLFVCLRMARRNTFALIVVLSTACIMLTESILERQMGLYFYNFFLLMVLNQKYTKGNKR